MLHKIFKATVLEGSGLIKIDKNIMYNSELIELKLSMRKG